MTWLTLGLMLLALTVAVTATEGEDSDSITVTKQVIPLNNPPVTDAGEDQTAECGESAILDGSGSTDPDSTEGSNDDIVQFERFLGREDCGFQVRADATRLGFPRVPESP